MLKKAGIYALLFFLTSFTGLAQKYAEFGVLVGRSYYLGEVNPKTHVGNDVGSLNLGAILRYNLNERYALRATYTRTKLNAKDENAEYLFNNTQRLASFETKLNEFAAGIEFNFLPYKTGSKNKRFTPYLFIGLSYYDYKPQATSIQFPDELIIDESGGDGLAYLFGPGIKFSLNRKFALGLEWGFRKTSNDKLDGIENRIDEVIETGKPYDNDWFVHSGFTLTYKITNDGPCPAYNF